MDNVANNNLISSNLPEERGWEFKQICVTRVPGYGFGIAVSGGRDNPHFASGDPSIAVSDVLASGPAERILQVNDRIISVNGITLQNVDYATAVQVLRDSGDTVTLVIKRRTVHHQHSHSLSATYSTGPPLAALGINPVPAKVTLTKNSKKEDFGIVLGCKLFVKEISSKARDQLLNTNQVLVEGDFITKINNTNCNELMSLKEAKKIIDSTKDKLHITVARDNTQPYPNHQAQSSISTTGAVNNFYKGDDFLTSQSYSNQNLYVQPPTRNPNLNAAINGGFELLDKVESGPNSLLVDDKSNLAPRGGRSRGPLDLNQMDNNRNLGSYGRSKRDEPPRPPPPRAEDYYSTRRQVYEDDPIVQKKQPIPDARFVTFHKEGSVGIRLTGGNFVGIFVTAVQPGSPASLQGLQPGDKILKVNDMDMTGVTREEAVLFLLSLQDRIELIVQYCREEYDSIVASQKGDSFYVKTHFHYDSPAKGEMSFRSGDIFHVTDTLYNGVVGCWQVFRIGRNNQEVQKGIIPNKARAEELATAQFNATKKEMSSNESRGSFFRRRRSSNRRSKSLGKEHWDDILFSDTVSKFPAYERVLLKHPGFTRPVILFGPIADVAREKLLKDFPDKFISPQLDTTAEDPKSKTSNIIRLSAIRDVISTGKHALLDITPNAVERLNYAQMYPIVVFFKAETKIVIKQLRQGLPKSAHKSSKKLLEQCQKLDKVWSHVFSSTVTLNDNTDTWYRKVREIIDKTQSNALWMSESKGCDIFSDIYFPPICFIPKPKTLSLPNRYRPSRRNRRAPLSMYSSPQFIHRIPSPARATMYSPQSSVYNSSSTIGQPYPEESLSDDFLFPMSSLRLSYASSPESDLEHSPGPPGVSPGSSPPQAGRLTKASSDPSVVMPDSSTTDILPPYQPNYDSRYGFNNSGVQNEPQTPTAGTPPGNKDLPPTYALSNQDIPGSLDQQNLGWSVGKNGLYSAQVMDFKQHKRQASTLHGPPPSYSHSKGHSISEQSPRRGSPKQQEAVYGQVPDLPPRIDRAVKPLGLTASTKIPNGRSAHERLFGTKPNQDNADQGGTANNNNGSDNNSFGGKLGSLERNQNSKSDSLSSYDSFNKQGGNNTRIGPNAHDDLKTTLSKIETQPGSVQNSPSSKYNNNSRWNNAEHQNSPHRHNSSKLDLKYGLPQNDNNNLDNNSPRNSRELDKEPGKDGLSPRNSAECDIYRYTRSPGKTKSHHVETKTDYGKYSRNNSSAQDYARSSHQDLSQSHLSIHQHSHHSSPMNKLSSHHNGYDVGGSHGGSHGSPHGGERNVGSHMGPPNGNNGYKPVPPPKPKNYKPPYNKAGQPQGGYGDGREPIMAYQHGKSHSNPVDQRAQNMNYYYNMPQQPNNAWQEPSMGPPAGSTNQSRYNHHQEMSAGHYDMAPPYESRRHPSISYASRSEITPISQHENPYGMVMDGGGGPHHQDILLADSHGGAPRTNNIVDLQGSREQRGSAFELYRKPVHHNLRVQQDASLFGSQPNIARKPQTNNYNSSSPKITPKLTKAQSFKHHKDGQDKGFKLFRKFSFSKNGQKQEKARNTAAMKQQSESPPLPPPTPQQQRNRSANKYEQMRPSQRDVTAATVDHRGGTISNEYWGVSLEIPENAIAAGDAKEIYFVITDPRLCDSEDNEQGPPLDVENGERMLSPIVMCGPQGTEFLKPVILNIPHYANTLPSLGISLKATDSEQNIHTDWDNIFLPSNHAANSVAVKVDHF